MGSPTVSVVIPAYNAERFLGDALDCLLGQTHRPAEIIVVDDGSTDGTSAVLARYGDLIRTIRQDNAGGGPARNTGLVHTTGQYVAFLDADDVCAPDRLERQVASLQQTPEAIACFTGHWTFDESGRIQESLAATPPADPDPFDFLAECQFVLASVMFDRARARGLSFPDDRRASGEDIIFSALLATRGRIISVPAPLYGYRQHRAQTSLDFQANATSNSFFEYRYRWAQENWQEHWPDRTWAELERKLWDGIVHQTEAAYWARHKRFFLNDRNYMRRHWPAHLPKPSVLGWRWYPDWLWAAKNWVDRRVRPA